jgi:hypothetical protein
MHSPCHQHSRLSPHCTLGVTDLRVSSKAVDDDREHPPFHPTKHKRPKGMSQLQESSARHDEGFLRQWRGQNCPACPFFFGLTTLPERVSRGKRSSLTMTSVSLRFQFVNQLKLKSFHVKSFPSNANHGLNNSTQGSRPSPDQRIAALGLQPFTDRQSMHWLRTQYAGVNIGQRLPLNRAELPPWRRCRHANCNLFE